jgi:glycosyltransferase involved in cell wall biosynthesis
MAGSVGGGGAPLVSVGLPVRNGAAFLDEALRSLLAQDHEHLELVVADNASDDATPEIVRSFTSDGRIRYVRNEADLGAIWNFNRVLDLARGDYFMWASTHDLWAPTMVSSCLSALADQSGAVLAYGRSRVIDPAGQMLPIDPDRLDTRGARALERYTRTLWTLRECQLFYGLWQMAVLRAIGGNRLIWSHDYLLLADASLRGEFVEVPRDLFSLRRDRPHEDADLEAWKRRVLVSLSGSAAWRRPETTLSQLYGELRNALAGVVLRSSLGWRDKTGALRETARCFEQRFGVPAPGRRARRAAARLAGAVGGGR